MDVTKAFSKFGNISFLRYNPGSNFAFVCFQSAGAFSCANNLRLPITTSQVKCAFVPAPAPSPAFALSPSPAWSGAYWKLFSKANCRNELLRLDLLSSSNRMYGACFFSKIPL